jgi:hypothetical protein
LIKPYSQIGATVDISCTVATIRSSGCASIRMRQEGKFLAIRRLNVDHTPLYNASLNGIATSTDGSKIYRL